MQSSREDGHALAQSFPAPTSEGYSRAGQVENASAGAAPDSALHGELDQHCKTTLGALMVGMLCWLRKVSSGAYKH